LQVLVVPSPYHPLGQIEKQEVKFKKYPNAQAEQAV
jgi:hypothetical protein